MTVCDCCCNRSIRHKLCTMWTSHWRTFAYYQLNIHQSEHYCDCVSDYYQNGGDVAALALLWGDGR
jgi:hypothetical protein